jgi:phospholipid/cholesterol/gamma-HCH transport system permease protein
MDLMALDPVERVVAPRFLAGLLALPLLTGVFNAMAILGGVLFAVGLMGTDSGIFWSNMQQNVEFYDDYLSGYLKSLVFGAVAAFVAVYSGYRAAPTGEGVSKATTQTVVASAILILILDFVFTSLWV